LGPVLRRHDDDDGKLIGGTVSYLAADFEPIRAPKGDVEDDEMDGSLLHGLERRLTVTARHDSMCP
jgi:hypothetical protein